MNPDQAGTGTDGQATLLSARNVSKAFPGVLALDEVTFEVARGEVHALLGENGAGKSTLIKILGGALRPDAGAIHLGGKELRIAAPSDAEAAGIAVIYQEFNLVPMLTARENLFLGREQSRAGFFSQRDENRKARELFGRMNVAIDPESRCDALSVAQQQVVEIAKALAMDARVIIMDEPTATLTDQEVERLFDIISDLKSRGVSVIYVSHRLDEVFKICDRATVLRDGRFVGTELVGRLSRRRLIEMMVGRKLEHEFPSRKPNIGEPLLEVRDLGRDDTVAPCTLAVRKGEILALTGLVGAGRTELARLIFGADRSTSGTIRLKGRTLNITQPRDAIKHGICLLTEDRKQQGLVLERSVRENFGLPSLGHFARAGFISRRTESHRFATHIENIRIKLSDQEQPASTLSGGNQQKVVLAKWLEQLASVFIFDEPTRGIDVGAKFEIYQLMNELVTAGKGILMISSELPEVLGMADRILVMRDRGIVGEITDAGKATQEDIMHLAISGTQSGEQTAEQAR